MEFVEIFKLDERFLSVLLELTEAHKIKAPGFGVIYADEAILAHSNEAEYEAMVNDEKTAGLQDRLMVVRIPYNLRVSEEQRIYEKMLSEVDLRGTHISPLCLPLASIFAVLSRLGPPDKFGMSLIQKLRLYDGQYVEKFTPQDAREMQERAAGEGFKGVSPRYVINQISRAITHQQADCLDPLVLLDTMWGGLEQSTKLAREDQEHLEKLFTETRQAYEQMARRQVQKAFVENFDQVANDLVQRYLRGVDSFLENPDQHTGRIGQPDGNLERFMRSLERSVDIQDYDKATFRRAIHAQVTGLKNAGLPVNHQFDSRLEEAVIRKLCPGEREVARVLAPSGEQDPERLAKRDEVRQRLVREGGYHPDCAQRLLEHVSSFLNSDQRTSTQLPRALRWIRG
jgi:serine protein kinase